MASSALIICPRSRHGRGLVTDRFRRSASTKLRTDLRPSLCTVCGARPEYEVHLASARPNPDLCRPPALFSRVRSCAMMINVIGGMTRVGRCST